MQSADTRSLLLAGGIVLMLFVIHSINLTPVIGGENSQQHFTPNSQFGGEIQVVVRGDVRGRGDVDFTYDVNLTEDRIITGSQSGWEPISDGCWPGNGTDDLPSPDALLLVSCHDPSKITVTSKSTGKPKWSFDAPPFQSMVFRAWKRDSSSIAVITKSSYLEVYSATGLLAFILGHPLTLDKYHLWLLDAGTGRAEEVKFFPGFRMSEGAFARWVR